MFSLSLILSAFGGGVFGAALGALPAFIFCGFLVIAGDAIVIANGTGVITGEIAFGTFFGPHISFASGLAAAAYAAHKGSLDSGKDILTPLIKLDEWDVLFVGGIFGVIGYIINTGLVEIGAPTDTIALTVVISTIIKRLLWGDTGIFGSYDSELSDSRWNPSKEIAWLPFQMRAPQLLMIGLGVGLAASYITILTGVPTLSFGIAAISLIILQTMGAGPVTHHIAWPAAAAAAATGSIFIGAAFGIAGAFLCEFFARLFYDWGDTHIDPPACAITVLLAVAILFLGF